MRQNKAILLGAVCVGLILPHFTIAADAPTPRALLAQYVAQLQTAPEDQALRERIIRLELTLVPSPAVPAEARRLFAKAATYQQEAGNMRGYESLATSAREFAITAYKGALLIAPWWSDAYYGLSTSLEASGRLNEAEAALRLYLITSPGPAGASTAEDRLCAIAVKRNR